MGGGGGGGGNKGKDQRERESGEGGGGSAIVAQPNVIAFFYCFLACSVFADVVLAAAVAGGCSFYQNIARVNLVREDIV